MTDVVKMCDVIDNCTECPRYGDDCDGSAERLYTHEEAWGMCDLISRKSLNDVKFITIKGDKVEEAYRSGWNGAIECIIENTPSADSEQVTGKLKNHCDSLLKSDSDECKEQKSKLDLIRRADAIEALSRSSIYAWSIEQDQTAHNWALNIIKALPSAEAEQPKWSCTANFVAEQLERLKDMTDEERWDLFIRFFSPSAEAVQGEWILVKGSNGKDYHKCSKCGHTQEITGVKNYCAVCGARMKGGAE